MNEETPNNVENNPNKRRGKRRNKNFLSNAKKYAKKGQLGRGTQIPEELYQYFVGILESMKNGIDSEEERQSLVDNVLARTEDIELQVAGNQLGCRLLELLLPTAAEERLRRYLQLVGDDLRRLCADNFSSHVVETLIKVACDRATAHLVEEEEESPQKKCKREPRYSEEHVRMCGEWTVRIGRFLLNNLEEFVWERSPNHILRVLLRCLAGVTLLPGEKPKVNMFRDPLAQNKGIPPHQTKMVYKPTPPDYQQMVVECVSRLSSWPQLGDMPHHTHTSGLLQVLLFAVKNCDKNATKGLIKTLLNKCFAPEVAPPSVTDNDHKEDKYNPNSIKEEKEEKHDTTLEGDNKGDIVAPSPLPPVFRTEPSVRLVEAALFVSKKKSYTQLYARCFLGHLSRLAHLSGLNFTVQRLLDRVTLKEEFEPMFDELSSSFGGILASGNSGVLLALGKACLRLKARQTQFLSSLERALDCAEEETHFPLCCLRLLPLSRIPPEERDKDHFINIHGSVILQTLLHFQRPTRVVSGLLSLSAPRLVWLLCDTKGSHVADAFCTAPFVGVKARDKLVWKLKGYYQQLALSAGGSRAVDALLQLPSSRSSIMSELAEKSQLLNGSPSGRVVLAKHQVLLFRSDPDQWNRQHDKHTTKDNK